MWNIDKEKFLVAASIVAGMLGIAAFLAAWAFGSYGIFSYQGRLFQYAQTLALIAIWLELGAIYHKKS